MLWLKNSQPEKPPAPPRRADLDSILMMLTQNGLKGIPASTAIQYLSDHLPPRPTDRWGHGLPLSTVEQEKLDRIAAILFDPLRAGKLLRSGTLDVIERDALAGGQPGIYQQLRQGATMDMIKAGPPFPMWAEGVLGVLFGRDAALVYGAETNPEQPSRSKFNGKPPPPTPADIAGEPQLKGR